MSMCCLLGFKTEEEMNEYNKNNIISYSDKNEAIRIYCDSFSPFKVEYKDNLNVQDYIEKIEKQMEEKRINEIFPILDNNKRFELEREQQLEKQKLIIETNDFIQTFSIKKMGELFNSVSNDLKYFLILTDIENIDEYKNTEYLIDCIELK
jgi:hypothetical protein